MKLVFNPLSGTFDFVEDLSGYVPYTGATATLNLGSQDFTTTGNVGIGTTPTVPLHVRKISPTDYTLTETMRIEANAFNCWYLDCYSGTNYVSNIQRARRARGTIDIPASSEAYDVGMRWSSMFYVNGAFEESCLMSFTAGSTMSPYSSGKMLFWTKPATEEWVIERMSIDENGVVKVNSDFVLDSLKSKSYLGTDANGKVIEATVDLSGYAPLTGAIFTGNVTAPNLDISNWNTAYGWGNHASAGYLTSFTSLLSANNIWTGTNNFTGSLVVANSTTYVYFDNSTSNDRLNLWRTKSVECTEALLNSVPDEDWAFASNVDKDTYGSELYADDGTYYSGLGKTNEGGGSENFIGMMWQWSLPSGIDEINVTGLYAQVVGYNTTVHSELKIYNWSTSTWDSVATGTSIVADNDMNGTITSNVGNYINNNQVSYQYRTKTAPTGVTTMYIDYSRFGYLANVELDDQKWLGDLTVDGNFYVNGVYRPKSLVPLADDTYDLGSALFRWDNVYGVLGRLNDLVVTGSTSTIRGWTIDFYDTNSSRNQINFEYSSSYNYGTITFFTQNYVSTPNGTDGPQTLYGDNLTYERRTAIASSDAITMYGRRSTAYFHPQYLSSNTSTHLIAGGYSQSYGYLDETSAGNMAEKTNFISHIFDIPTFTAGSGTITGTSQKLSWFSQGDAMFASGQKLYFRGTLSGTTLTMDTTEYVNSDADGYLDLHAGTAVRANTGFIIPVGTTPSPAVAGALYVDTDASTNGDLMVYANSGWRKVVSLP